MVSETVIMTRTNDATVRHFTFTSRLTTGSASVVISSSSARQPYGQLQMAAITFATNLRVLPALTTITFSGRQATVRLGTQVSWGAVMRALRQTGYNIC